MVCYRHSDRETGVSCSNCGNPICPDCMTTTPVGMRCPDCAKQKTVVKTVGTLTPDPVVTYALIGANALAYAAVLATGGRSSNLYQDSATLGIGAGQTDFIGVAEGEVWRLVSGGFMHDAGNPLHILFNMYILYILGSMLEPSLGRPRFIALYFASLLAGSFGALLLDPQSFTVGASGAVFGLMAAAFLNQRAQGIDPMQSGIGTVILLNLGITFLIPGISIGGHIGGLIGGALCFFAIDRIRRGTRNPWPGVAACAAIGLAAAAGGLIAANAEKSRLGLDAVAALLG